MKLKTNVIITHKKNGNINKLISPYDFDNVINKPIETVGDYNNKILTKLFKGFGNI